MERNEFMTTIRIEGMKLANGHLERVMGLIYGLPDMTVGEIDFRAEEADFVIYGNWQGRNTHMHFPVVGGNEPLWGRVEIVCGAIPECSPPAFAETLKRMMFEEGIVPVLMPDRIVLRATANNLHEPGDLARLYGRLCEHVQRLSFLLSEENEEEEGDAEPVEGTEAVN